MAGMFYSLEEVAEKLKMTKEQVTQIVQQGKLREFRDGPNLLFKVDEVEALASETAGRADSGDEVEADVEIGLDDLTFADELEEPTFEIESEEPAFEIPEDVSAADAGEDAEISLADSADGAIFDSDLTSADTSITTEDVNVLGGSESAFDITDDTMADTIAAAEGSHVEPDELSLASSTGDDLLLEQSSMAAGSQEQSLTSFGDDSLPSLGGESASALDDDDVFGSGEGSGLKGIDDDVNLDSFGSGSGLLDLSLQADDTSLGGILDEIYTPQDGGDQAEMPMGQASSEMNAEVDQILGDDGMESPEPVAAPMTARAVYAEAEPDAVSNAFGYMMFLPLLALIYTGIVGVAGHMGVRPAILEQAQGVIWYVMGAAAVISLLIVGIPAMMSSQGSSAGKEKKPKKEKAPKAAKAPKAPKVKKQKPEKPQKQKKAKK